MAAETASLTFWKPSPKSKKPTRPPPPPAQIAAALLAGSAPPAPLANLPVTRIVRALEAQYPTLERTAQTYAEVDIDAEQTGIEIAWSPKHFHFQFYGDAYRQMELVAALMAGFGCSCYYSDEKDTLYPPTAPPKFVDEELDARLNTLFGKLAQAADAPGPTDPQSRLKRVLDFMKSPDAGKQLDPPPAPKPRSKRKP